MYYLNYSVLSTLSEYTYFYISKSITSYTFVAYLLTYLLTYWSFPLLHFTSPKRLWNNYFWMQIYRNIQTFAFQVLRQCSSWESRNGALQRFFWHQPETCFCLYCGSIYFIILSELRFVKWVRIFKQNCIVKSVIFFSTF